MSEPSPLRKRLWAEIDLNAAEHNFRVIRERLAPETKLCCVVKANAYGHGAVMLSRLYEELGAHWLAVSNIEEAIQLRRAGLSLPILILGYTDPHCAGLLAEHRVSQTVYSYDYAEELSLCAAEAGVTLPIHIKLDSGMGRIGFCCRHGKEDAQSISEAIAACRLPRLSPEGIFTHFAVADEGEEGIEPTKEQLAHFRDAIRTMEQAGISFALRHCANSAGILDFPEAQEGMDMVRAGIILYGVPPSDVLRFPADLRPVLSLHSVISMVKELQAGDTVSYGATFTAPRPMRVATVPVGYADGYRRENGALRSYMLVGGKRVPILGRVCMDQLMLDVTDLATVRRGDPVVVLGQMGESRVTADELARRNRTINYELFCNVGERVPRIYKRDGRTVAILDHLIPESPSQTEKRKDFL